MKQFKVRVGSRQPKELRKVTVTGEPPGPMQLSFGGRWPDDVHDLRALGRAIDAHALVELLFRAVAKAQQDGITWIPVPTNLAGEIILALSARPGPRQGRPRKPSTNDAMDLVKTGVSKRKAAKSISPSSGESPENLRRRLRPSKSKPRDPKRR
jgi:hypothetical protein